MTETVSDRLEHGEPPAPLVPIRVWDLPTRLLHWALAVLFVAAVGIASLASEHSPAFRWHMLAGLMMAGVVVLRLGWGILGSRYARISSFLHGPVALARYLRDSLKGTDSRQAGHNPGAAYGAIAMFVLPLAIVASGLMMQGRKEAFEDVHKVLAYGMLGVVVAHLAGLGFHALRHRDRTAGSMVTGRKLGLAEEGIPSFRPLSVVVMALLLGGWGAVLMSAFDAGSGVLSLPGTGTSFQLGKADKRDGESGEKREKHKKHEKDDDD